MSENNQTTLKQNKMGTMPIPKLVLTMALPMIISMLIQALYNIVDGLFISSFNQNAYTAINLAFPIQNVMIGIATGTGVGVNALLSRSLGERDHKKANKIAAQGVILAGVGYLIVLIFSLTGVEYFINLITSSQSDPAILSSIKEINEFGVTYITICASLSFGVFGQIIFERLMQSTGKTFLSMYTQITGAIINIILDPILIFGKFGLPQMGVKGAAVATVIGQICAFIMGIILNHFWNKEIRLKFKNFKPDFKLIKNICAIGVPSIIMVVIGSFMYFAMFRLLFSIKIEASTVFGSYFKLQSFFFMPVFGLNNGLIPIIAYNYGARNKERLMKTVFTGTIIATSIMAIGLLVMQILPAQILSIFSATDEVLEIGVPALRIISPCFVFAALCIVLTSVFQALGKGMFAMFISIARQLMVLVPVAYLLSLTGLIWPIWFSFPIAEIASVCASLLFFKNIYKNNISSLKEPV